MYWYVSKSSSSGNFEKFPFNQNCKLRVYRNTTKNELLTKFPKGVLKASIYIQEKLCGEVSLIKF